MSTLDNTFAALADPTRRAIIARLAQGSETVTRLADPFPMSLPAVSKHLNVLESAGLILRKREGRTQRCSLVATPLRDAACWVAAYEQFWHTQLDALSDHLNR